MPTHTVRTGETLATIARKYGHSDWKTIYDHPANAEFQRKRPNPNIILPGDVIFIPDQRLTTPIHKFTDDDFESVKYDLDYRSEGGNLSKYLKAHYSNGADKDIQMDAITETQPRLWAAKQQALKIMDDYNANFILGSVFPAVFFILTISPTSTPVTPLRGLSRPRYTVSMRQLPKPPVNTASEGAGLVAQLRQAGKRVAVNIGGTGEVADAINLNPNQVAPRKGIPNWIAKEAEQIGQVFGPNSVDEIVSNRLPPNTIEWTKVLPGAHKVLRPGGSISIRFQGVGGDGPIIMEQLRKLGFRNINNPMNMGAVIEAVK
jgi:LysM domain